MIVPRFRTYTPAPVLCLSFAGLGFMLAAATIYAAVESWREASAFVDYIAPALFVVIALGAVVAALGFIQMARGDRRALKERRNGA